MFEYLTKGDRERERERALICTLKWQDNTLFYIYRQHFQSESLFMQQQGLLVKFNFEAEKKRKIKEIRYRLLHASFWRNELERVTFANPSIYVLDVSQLHSISDSSNGRNLARSNSICPVGQCSRVYREILGIDTDNVETFSRLVALKR